MRPRLRSLEIFPVEIDGQSLVCFRDQSGLIDGALVMQHPAAVIAMLCDGARELDDIAVEFERATGVAVSREQVAQLVDALDESLLLHGPRVEARRLDLEAEFRAAALRSAQHAGGAYPGDPAELRASLEGWRAHVAGEPPPPTLRPVAGSPAVLVSPHIDYERGCHTYARAYRALDDAPPDLVVVFGTDHVGVDHCFTLTRKAFATPLGEVPVEADLVDGLAARLGPRLFADELHHRGEHSIELQAVWLRHLWGERTPPMLPVLCGPVRRAEMRPFLTALRELTAARRVLVVAGADLAHVGPRFGDEPVARAGKEEVEAADREALAAAVRGDADGFYGSIARINDRFRVCGLSPIYAALAFAGAGRGALLDYAQCPADDGFTSMVTIAALALV